MVLKFTKMTGAGNDFVLIDNRAGSLQVDWTGVAAKLCDRRYGIGADGLLILESSHTADFMMKYYNADGSYGGMCGNGGRCAARFVMDSTQRDTIAFEALDFIYRAARSGTSIKLKMKDPTSIRSGTLEINHHRIPYTFVDTGTAHAVIFVEQLDPELAAKVTSGDITTIGSNIRNDPAFSPGGTNVDFVQRIDDHTLRMRTYERGVEAETLACGTGAIASAVVAHIGKLVEVPTTIQTRSKEKLMVEFEMGGKEIRGVTLTGSAYNVFEGSIQLDV
ncbi:MAG TPA: diaminopimelate epimerase [Bacteroidota bacterium]|nr:diaminopimelate epimerase [Bacteroidota bacterium]